MAFNFNTALNIAYSNGEITQKRRQEIMREVATGGDVPPFLLDINTEPGRQSGMGTSAAGSRTSRRTGGGRATHTTPNRRPEW